MNRGGGEEVEGRRNIGGGERREGARGRGIP